MLRGTFKAVTYGPQQLYVLLSQLAVNILHLLKLLLVSFGVLWNPQSTKYTYTSACTAILDRDTQQRRLQKLLRCGCHTPSVHLLQHAGNGCSDPVLHAELWLWAGVTWQNVRRSYSQRGEVLLLLIMIIMSSSCFLFCAISAPLSPLHDKNKE